MPDRAFSPQDGPQLSRFGDCAVTDSSQGEAPTIFHQGFASTATVTTTGVLPRFCNSVPASSDPDQSLDQLKEL